MSQDSRTTMNVRVPEQLLSSIDELWEERGFSSRSEFVRSVLRDSITKESDLNESVYDEIDPGMASEEEEVSLEEIEQQLSEEAHDPFTSLSENTTAVISSDIGYQNSLPNTDLDIRVIGCGGGGISIVDKIQQRGLTKAQTISIDTDKDALDEGGADTRVLIGASTFDGEGAEGDSETLRSILPSLNPALRDVIQEPDLVFVVSGLGGGTGSVLAPQVAKLAAETDATVVGVGALPFKLEQARMSRAKSGLEDFDSAADTLAVIDGNRIATESNLPFGQALERMNRDIATVIEQLIESSDQFRFLEEDEGLLPMLNSGGRAVLMSGEHDINSEPTFSDRLIRYSNVDVQDHHIEQAILLFQGGGKVNQNTIDSIIADVADWTDQLAWSAQHSSHLQHSTISFAGILTGVDVELDHLIPDFDRATTDTEADVEIMPSKGASATSHSGNQMATNPAD